MTVKNYLCNALRKFLIKIKITWRCKFKEQAPQLALLYCGRIVRSSHRRCSIKKAVLKNFAISTGNICVGVSFLKSCRSEGFFYLFLSFFIKKKPQIWGSLVNITKFLKLPLSKNICHRLLLTVSMVHCYMGLKVQGTTHNVARFQGPSHRPSFLFLSQHLSCWTESRSAFENLRQIPLMSQLNF